MKKFSAFSMSYRLLVYFVFRPTEDQTVAAPPMRDMRDKKEMKNSSFIETDHFQRSSTR